MDPTNLSPSATSTVSEEASETPLTASPSQPGFPTAIMTPTGMRSNLEDVSLTPDNFSQRSISPTTVLTVDSSQSCFTISEDVTEYIEDQRTAVKLQQNYRVFGGAKPSTLPSYVLANPGAWRRRMRDFLGVSLLDPENKRPPSTTSKDEPTTSSARVSFELITEEDLSMQRQRLFYEEKYYLNLIKTNVWLSMISKSGELVTCAITGFIGGFATWLSNALQLVFNFLSSIFLLWRYRGQYSTSKTDADLHRVRERLCIFFQSFCKLLGATTLLVFAVLAMTGKIDHMPNEADAAFMRTSMLTGSVSTGGTLTRAGLACWTSWLLRKPQPSSTKSVSSENKLTWINTLLSFKTAVVSFYVSHAGTNPDKISEAVKVSNGIDVVLGAVSVYYGLIDLLFGFSDRKMEKNEKAAAGQMGPDFVDEVDEVDTADHFAPQDKEIVF